VALVLGTGVRGRDALAVAHEVLRVSGGVVGLAGLPLTRLTRASGIGPSRGAGLVAAIELGRRAVAGPRPDRPRVASPAAAAEYLLPRIGRLREEHFGVRRPLDPGAPIGRELVAEGVSRAFVVAADVPVEGEEPVARDERCVARDLDGRTR
jgi:DNA repair protein RadC